MKRTSLKRGPAPKRKTRIKLKRSKPRRVTVLRSLAYRRWAKEHYGCFACSEGEFCGRREFAHGPIAGSRYKGGDDEGIVLGTGHHAQQHRIGWPAFEKRYGISRSEIAAQMYVRYCMEMGKQ